MHIEFSPSCIFFFSLFLPFFVNPTVCNVREESVAFHVLPVREERDTLKRNFGTGWTNRRKATCLPLVDAACIVNEPGDKCALDSVDLSMTLSYSSSLPLPSPLPPLPSPPHSLLTLHLADPRAANFQEIVKSRVTRLGIKNLL